MNSFGKAVAAAAMILLASSCNAFLFDIPNPGQDGNRYSDALIYIAVGYNNLSGSISGNINTVLSSSLPSESSGKALVICSHLTKDNGTRYDIPTPAHIVKISSGWDGQPICDTLYTTKDDIMLTNPSDLRSVLEIIKERVVSDHYFLIYSSHGTGWLPENYYDSPQPGSGGILSSAPAGIPHQLVPGPSDGLFTKSIGCEGRNENGRLVSHETELTAFKSAIPEGMHFDFIFFDACLMGGIETAYELKEITDGIGFSQTEILSAGFDYRPLTRRLLAEKNPEGLCDDYYRYYEAQSGTHKSATISYIDCRELEGLATVCRELFEKYRNRIAALTETSVQGYYRNGKHWFFDLEDILVQSGIDAGERDRLSAALSACVKYKAATEKFMLAFEIKKHCGLSSYLPGMGDANLDAAYRKLAWNKATLLIK